MLSLDFLLQPLRPSVGGCMLLIWLLWRLQGVVKQAVKPKRTNIEVIEYPTILGRWISGIRYLWAGPNILLQSHTEKPYAVRTPETYFVHFSAETHIKELIEAPEQLLSLHALSKDMFLPKLTMNGLEVDDRMSANGSLHSRVLRVVLRSHLDDLQPSLIRAITQTVEGEMSLAKRAPTGWKKLQTFSVAKKIIAMANSVAFFGESLSSNKDFVNAALDYPEDLLKTAEILRLLPSAVRPVLAPILMRQHQASNILVQHLIHEVEKRLEQRDTGPIPIHRSLDCVQFFIDASARRDSWSAWKIVQVILGIWFAAVHQPALSLVYALDDLCIYPEFAERLRSEVENCVTSSEDLDSLPLLDSFLKESARIHPSDSISVRRKVLQPYMFADGTTLLEGDVACVPLQAIMRDPAVHPESLVFDPCRFINKTGEGNTARFTETSPAYPLWGLGKHACPGRYYAARVLKLVLAHVLMKYDIQMTEASKDAKRTFNWRSSIVPKSSTSLLFRERDARAEERSSEWMAEPPGCATGAQCPRHWLES